MVTQKYTGLIVAVVTPFDTSGEVNISVLADHLDWLIKQGVHGVMVTGTAGEFANLSDDERLLVAGRTVQTVGGRVPVIFHTGHMNRAAALALSRRAEDAGVDAVMLTPPPIIRPTQTEIERYFREIAAAVSINVVIYNNPSRVAVNISADTLIRLSEVDNIVALKDSGRNLNETADVINEAGDRMAILSGETDLFLPILALGGMGGILTMPNFIPKIHLELFEKFQRGDLEKARILNKKLAKFSKVLSVEGKYHAAIKAAMRQVGIPIGFPRLPLTDVSVDTQARIREQLKKEGLLPS